LVANRLCLTLW